MKHDRSSTGRVAWMILVGGLVVVTLAMAFDPAGSPSWQNAQLLFTLVTVTAASCVIASTITLAIADQREMAEIGLLGTALMVTSVLPLVHGLTTPGVLYESNEAFRTSSYLALPVAVLAASPLLFPTSRFGRWAAQRWRDWALLALLGVFALASAVVFFPDTVTVPGPTAPFTVAMTVLVVGSLAMLSLRQLRLFELGQSVPNLGASCSLAFLAVAGLMPLVETPYSAFFWWLHLTGTIGVLGACIGLVVTRRPSKSAQDVLEPVLVRDPLIAFELGLSPVVHRFVADLERKDKITRDHTIRTGELAMRVGERMRLPARDLRNLGLAAMLHDVGKLNTPDGILKKPAGLTADEYGIIQHHPCDGEQMLASEPSLSAAAQIVRSHHERMDGAGYPDGLVGEQIPLASRIIAVCDALDAMTHDRPYRAAMPVAMAFAILREHAGSQWDQNVVSNVMATLPSMAPAGTLAAVGHPADGDVDVMVVPDDLGRLLATVDAEI